MSDRETTKSEDSPLSIRRLTNAFAAMLGRKPSASGAKSDAAPRETPTNTRTITEALLFVGRPDNQPMSAAALAATMRDITPEEVATAVDELNAEYLADSSAMTIEQSAGGYKMVLREEYSRVRDKFHGKLKQTTLTPTAMEVLSVVAYRQPIELAAINELRGQNSQSLANSLVRRGLLRLERPADNPKRPLYRTTEQFLKVFGLTHINQLPQAAEFEVA
ncbi:SMC-Scp complex subunit ScpB [Aeoliella mucimassa]|uniref:Segregation and condensation protein B n=1 Tax=Aeoliella mucimassa TaxID=2527972 RepID=A0A518AH75_9BACT|nr:SMC-Scp complex subunit ScpB [Aeoliella mucimassa]QDU54066.1 Segregation and condensation protein B [Aeoliella mucimassa]